MKNSFGRQPFISKAGDGTNTPFFQSFAIFNPQFGSSSEAPSVTLLLSSILHIIIVLCTCRYPPTSGSSRNNLDCEDIACFLWIKHSAAFSMKIPNFIPFSFSIKTRAWDSSGNDLSLLVVAALRSFREDQNRCISYPSWNLGWRTLLNSFDKVSYVATVHLLISQGRK